MTTPCFLGPEELLQIRFQSLGSGVLIDRSVRLVSPERISIGNNVRIDCFSVISAGSDGISIGSNVHIASGCYIFGGGGEVVLGDFSGLSSRVTVFTATDDYTSGALTNPTVPIEFRNVQKGKVLVGRHAIIGCGSTLLPGIVIGYGAAVGAMSLVKKDVESCDIVFGVPAKSLRMTRNRSRLESGELAYRKSLPE